MALVVGTNSYVSNSDADTYFADTLNADFWNTLTDTKQDQGLVSASQQISLFVSDGCKLPFAPPLDNTNLEAATSELALFLIQNPASLNGKSYQNRNVSLLTTGTTHNTVEFNKLREGDESRFPPIVMTYLEAAGCIEESSLFAAAAFGEGSASTSEESEFDSASPFAPVEEFK
jgi:hypothetical protein